MSLVCFIVMHVKKPLNDRCHMGTQWIIPVVSLHAIYVAILVGFTGAIRHIEFRFDELRDLWQGILVSASSIGTPLWSSFGLLRNDILWFFQSRGCNWFYTIVVYSLLTLLLIGSPYFFQEYGLLLTLWMKFMMISHGFKLSLDLRS